MRRSLRERLTFTRPKGPGYGISKSFYLSVLTGSAAMPSLKQVIDPKGIDGAVVGMGAPLVASKDKSILEHPMQRGAYAFASLDQKTVIRGIVLSKEEAGFDPEVFVRLLGANADTELLARIRTTWQLVQLTFESHDPNVWPAVDFVLSIAQRLGELTTGVIADPVSQVYKLPGDLISERDSDENFQVFDVVWPHFREIGNGMTHLSTRGLVKFGFAELEFCEVREDTKEVAARFIMSLANQFLLGQKLTVGDIIGSKDSAFQLAEGGLDRALWDGIPCIEVIPQSGDLSESLRKWNAGL